MKRVIFSVVMVAGFVLAGVGCSNKCPENMINDGKALFLMPGTNKAEFAAAAKKCDDFVDQYKSNDQCIGKDDKPIKIENWKTLCTAFHAKAK